MSKSKEKTISSVAVFKHLIATAWRNFPGVALLGIILSAANGFSTAAATWVKQLFFDSVENAIGGGLLSRAIGFGIVFAVFMVLIMCMDGMTDVVSSNLMRKLQGCLTANLNKKAAEIDPIHYEDNIFLDSINKAYKGAEGAAQVFSAFFKIISYSVPYFVVMTIYLASLQPILAVCVLLSFAPSFIGQIVRLKQYSALEGNVAPMRRKYEYYERCINDREYAKETRLWGCFWFFRKLYDTYLDMFCDKSWKITRKVELTEVAIRFVLLAGYIGTIVLMFHYLMAGVISVGAFAAVFSSIDQMFDSMEYTFNYDIGGITENMGTVKNYISFINTEKREASDTEVAAKSVRLENAGFAYPNANTPSLRNINLEIKPGETIAIVGENGAGKSTIAKLITGLYQPTEGSVYLDGIDTRSISTRSTMNNISGVFQKYQRYKMTLRDNVSISRTDIPADEGRIRTMLEQAEVSLENRSFADGLDTMLSREFDGTDLSGGQWQRVAIARGLYRNHNLIILDEPTAAIDPVEETRIYKLFATLSEDKTSVIITHRLGSAKIADRIAVMDEGEIVDIGKHDELMERDGLYKNMYNAQAQWYD